MDASGGDIFQREIVFSADVNGMQVEHEDCDSYDWAAAAHDSEDEWGVGAEFGDEAMRRDDDALDF